MRVFCVIPAYNEEKQISNTVHQVRRSGFDVVVVNDGSSDLTAELARKAGAIVLDHATNRGQGAALQTGNEYALKKGAEIIVHFDADGQFLAEEIKDVIAPILVGEAEAVFGSRFLGKDSNMPILKKRIFIPLAHLINRLLIGRSLSDPQSGFRALSGKAWQKIEIKNDGMAHCSEILHKTFKNNLRIKEVPITVVYKEFGQSFGGGWRIVKDLLLAKFLD